MRIVIKKGSINKKNHIEIADYYKYFKLKREFMQELNPNEKKWFFRRCWCSSPTT
jgi:hypothetical protein